MELTRFPYFHRCLGVSMAVGTAVFSILPAWALPPEADIPEEVLRTEIITEARSPVNGEPLSAQEYAELQTEIAETLNAPPTLDPRIREVIFLLQIRQAIRSVFPFLLR